MIHYDEHSASSVYQTGTQSVDFYSFIKVNFPGLCCCCCSGAKSRPTLCGPMNGNTSGASVLHCLPMFAQIHVLWAVLSITSFTCPLLLLPSILPRIRGSSNESALHISFGASASAEGGGGGNSKPLQYSCHENPWAAWKGKKILHQSIHEPPGPKVSLALSHVNLEFVIAANLTETYILF